MYARTRGERERDLWICVGSENLPQALHVESAMGQV